MPVLVFEVLVVVPGFTGARVVVAPDHFYAGLLQAPIPQAGEGKRQLKEVLRQTRQSGFTIFSRTIPLQ